MATNDILIYKYANQIKRRVLAIEHSRLNARERARLRAYADFLVATNISQGRILKNLHFLFRLSEDLGFRLDSISQRNVQDVVGKINLSDYSEHSKHDLKAIIKKYLKWALGKRYDTRDWEWLKTRIAREKVKLPAEGDILTVDEVEQLIAVCTSVRDRAMIASLYESACRPSEILTLKIRDVRFDKYGCILNLRQSKTIIRPVRLVNAAPYLSAWLNIHPGQQNTNAPLWVVPRTGANVGLNTLDKSLKALARSAGIRKRIYSYLLRHSRITHLLRNPRIPHSIVKRIVGWTDDSSQISTYLHLSNDTIDRVVLEANGVHDEIQPESLELTKGTTCARCGTHNTPVSKVCSRCWLALDAAFQTEIDEVATDLASMVQDAETLRLLQTTLSGLRKKTR